MKVFSRAVLCLAIAATAQAQVNAGERQSDSNVPFVMTQMAQFNLPWRIAVLPDGNLLVTEKVGPVWLVSPAPAGRGGANAAPTMRKTSVGNTPTVLWQGQGGMLGVYLSPNYATDKTVYLTYGEPGDSAAGSSLALAKAKLVIGAGWASFEGMQVIWRDGARGRGGQFGGAVAFSPDKQFLYLTVGDRQRMTPAQDPNSPLGKIVRLTLDGKPAPGNPMAGKTGSATLDIINPPRNTELAKTAEKAYTYTFPGTNLTQSETWATGFRTPYGLAFGPDGRLWEVEHGPQGGDELNLIEPGKNYGWPLVSFSKNYDNTPIPSPDTRADLQKPVIYWTPIIAPGSLTFYNSDLFPEWKGSALMGGMATQTINRITFDGKGGATAAERWSVGKRIRDIAVGADGSLWLIEDANPGALIKVTPQARTTP